MMGADSSSLMTLTLVKRTDLSGDESDPGAFVWYSKFHILQRGIKVILSELEQSSGCSLTAPIKQHLDDVVLPACSAAAATSNQTKGGVEFLCKVLFKQRAELIQKLDK